MFLWIIYFMSQFYENYIIMKKELETQSSTEQTAALNFT